jgi:hypothetical protein
VSSIGHEFTWGTCQASVILVHYPTLYPPWVLGNDRWIYCVYSHCDKSPTYSRDRGVSLKVNSPNVWGLRVFLLATPARTWIPRYTIDNVIRGYFSRFNGAWLLWFQVPHCALPCGTNNIGSTSRGCMWRLLSSEAGFPPSTSTARRRCAYVSVGFSKKDLLRRTHLRGGHRLMYDSRCGMTFSSKIKNNKK